MRLEVDRAIGEVGEQHRAEPDPQRGEAAQIDREDPRGQLPHFRPRGATSASGIDHARGAGCR